VTNWVKTVQHRVAEDPVLAKVRDGELLTEAEERELAERLNQPSMYFNEENLRRAYRSPSGSLVDFVRAALGLTKVKSHEERVDELVSTWLIAKGYDPDRAAYLTLLKHRGVIKGKVAVDDLFEPPLSLQDAGTRGVELFGEEGLRQVVSDMNESVFSKSDEQQGVA